MSHNYEKIEWVMAQKPSMVYRVSNGVKFLLKKIYNFVRELNVRSPKRRGGTDDNEELSAVVAELPGQLVVLAHLFVVQAEALE